LSYSGDEGLYAIAVDEDIVQENLHSAIQERFEEIIHHPLE